MTSHVTNIIKTEGNRSRENYLSKMNGSLGKQPEGICQELEMILTKHDSDFVVVFWGSVSDGGELWVI